MELSVGRRLKDLRLKTGISQRELARRAAQSPAAVSAIELDKVSPSVATLKRVLEAMGVSLGEFFSVDPDEAPGAFFGPDDMTDVSLGPIHYHQLGRSPLQTPLRLVQVRADPGSDTGLVSNRVDTDEIGYVLSGRIEVTIGSDTRVLSSGWGYVAKGSLPQRFRNHFDEPCAYVFVTSQPGF